VPLPVLTEPAPGFFVLTCDYEDRFLPKNAGFRWHPGERCRAKGCKPCSHGIEKAWWTDQPLKAHAVIEYADDGVRASLERRAEPALAGAAKDQKRAARAEKAKKLHRMQSLAASRAKDSKLEVPSPPGLEYLGFQRAGIAYALGRPNTLFADEMGLGKTIEALGTINADPDAKRVLIVCPASLKLNWAREAERWLVGDRTIGIVGKAFPDDADVVIVNYERLGKWKRELAETWDVLVADECHYAKNRKSQRSKNLVALDARRKLFLTGTPILNRPVEIHPIAAALDPATFGHFWTFAKRYCAPLKTNFGWDVSGASNLVELHELLRGTIMVRRTKADVLTELPPKRRQVIELGAEGFTKLLKVEKAAWDEHQQRLAELRRRSGEARARKKAGGDVDEEELRALREGLMASFGELSKLRHATALAKVPLVVEHVQNALEATDKIVVFAHHRDVIAEIADAFDETAVTLTGEDQPEARQAAVDRFQTDPSCAVFVGSIRAAGLGLTLTASAHVVFAELDWVPANLTQAEDRTHRIGQQESVLVQHLVLQDSLDARMVRTLLAKQRVVDEALEGVAVPRSEGDALESDDLASAIIEAACDEPA